MNSRVIGSGLALTRIFLSGVCSSPEKLSDSSCICKALNPSASLSSAVVSKVRHITTLESLCVIVLEIEFRATRIRNQLEIEFSLNLQQILMRNPLYSFQIASANLARMDSASEALLTLHGN